MAYSFIVRPAFSPRRTFVSASRLYVTRVISTGKRYRTKLYNLEAILAIGYRVRSPRGVQFRQWATTTLREYLVKGFVMNDERLKEPDGWDYFDELLARIRDIRASEKRFYQKVRDLFALSQDYQDDERAAQDFFAEVQNKMLHAVALELLLGFARISTPPFLDELLQTLATA